MGRLALIADTLGESVIAAAVRGNMKTVLAPWFAGTNPNPLKYDPIWGGICSSAGLANGGADFGNGQYNECALSDYCSIQVGREARRIGDLHYQTCVLVLSPSQYLYCHMCSIATTSLSSFV